MTALFSVTSEPTATIIEMALPEQLDSSEFDNLNADLLSLIKSGTGKAWVIDLSSVTYLGSAMLGMMVNIRMQVKKLGGKLFLTGLSPRLLEIFKTCCMEKLFVITRSRADALRQTK